MIIYQRQIIKSYFTVFGLSRDHLFCYTVVEFSQIDFFYFVELDQIYKPNFILVFQIDNLKVVRSIPVQSSNFLMQGPRFLAVFRRILFLNIKKFNSKVNLIFFRKLRLIFALNLTKSFIFVKIFTSLVVLKGVFSPNLGEKVTLTRASISFRLKSS